MTNFSRRAALALLLVPLAACGRRERRASAAGPDDINRLIAKYARLYDVPEDLVHRVVQRESSYNPGARNGPYYGLMQILPETARTMGYRGTPEGLLDAETNLTFAVKYLRGAWIVARGDRDAAVMWYARGYYYEAKRLGLLKETGLRS
ncbi:MAG: lytic transglycosylase domain-containing protein [Albidovulum sp.]